MCYTHPSLSCSPSSTTVYCPHPTHLPMPRLTESTLRSVMQCPTRDWRGACMDMLLYGPPQQSGVKSIQHIVSVSERGACTSLKYLKLAFPGKTLLNAGFPAQVLKRICLTSIHLRLSMNAFPAKNLPTFGFLLENLPLLGYERFPTLASLIFHFPDEAFQ